MSRKQTENKWFVALDLSKQDGTIKLKSGSIVTIVAGASSISSPRMKTVSPPWVAVVRSEDGQEFAVDAICVGRATKNMWRHEGAHLVNILTGKQMAVPSNISAHLMDEILVKRGKRWTRALDEDFYQPLAGVFMLQEIGRLAATVS